MYIVVGLGNPTKEYNNTRHNIGFDIVDFIIDKYDVPYSGTKHKAMYGSGLVDGTKVVLAKPLTYMNLSGEAVRSLIDFYKIDPEEELIVIYDDVNLPPGKLRIREKGTAGGHNGIKSIIQHLGTTKFKRIRVGVGEKPKGWNLADYVLGRFSKEDRKLMDEAIKNSDKAITMMIRGEVAAAMNEFNEKNGKKAVKEGQKELLKEKEVPIEKIAEE